MSESALGGRLTHLLHETPIFDALDAERGYSALIEPIQVEPKACVDNTIQTLRKNLGIGVEEAGENLKSALENTTTLAEGARNLADAVQKKTQPKNDETQALDVAGLFFGNGA